MHLLYQERPFDQCIILVPPLHRRIVSAKIDDLHIRVCSNMNLDENYPDFHYYKNEEFIKQWKKAQEQIIEDKSNVYSDKYFDKITDFCAKNNIDLYCSAWEDHTYDYLQNKTGFALLPKFPVLEIFDERADDLYHPHKKHYEYFVHSILENDYNKILSL